MPKTRVTQHRDRAERAPIQTKVTIDLEVTFAPGVKVNAEELLETVPDALWLHDSRNRLLPGVPPGPKGERIIGTAIKVEKVEQEIDLVWRVSQKPFDKPEGWDATEQERSTIVDVSGAIETAIEELRELQAGLWEHYERLQQSQGAEITASKKAALRAIQRVLRAKVMSGIEVKELP